MSGSFGTANSSDIEAMPDYTLDRNGTCCAVTNLILLRAWRIITDPHSRARIQAMAAAQGHSLAADMAARGALQEPVELQRSRTLKPAG